MADLKQASNNDISIAGKNGEKNGKEIKVGQSLELHHLDEWEQEFQKSTFLTLSRNVLSKNDPIETLTSREVIVANEKVFNLTLKDPYPGQITDQANAGTCWIFAATNMLRYHIINKLNLGDFQLSQSYLLFYHKLERANWYLERIIETKDQPLDSRIVLSLNDSPAGDGGEWDIFINLIEKYGIVPQYIFPKSFTSGETKHLNLLLFSKLRVYAVILRSTTDQESIQSLKAGFLKEIYNLLTVTFGKIPMANQKFTWDYYDKDNRFHTWSGTPLEYYQDVVIQEGMNPRDSVDLVHDPRHPYETNLIVTRHGSVKGGRPLRFTNAPIEVLEEAVIYGIKANIPVFFGMDIRQATSNQLGIMDTNLFSLESAYGFNLNITKADRLNTKDTRIAHGMVITAVHVDEESGKAVKYKVENSWGEKSGDKGWFVMSAEWFREHGFQVVVPKSCVDQKWVDVERNGKTIILEPWDAL